ncbi:MAG: tetratricopeptide repeat protein, partial [Acidobacteriales bacterium]|nr:tetratricopeptide repeat protein [Terriglobales bacterium]
KKSRWDAAEKHFQEAIRIYAQYAPAWFELGRTQVLQNNPAAAQQSFEQALKADPKFVSPYQALAELAARQEHWAEVVKFTDAVLALNPTNFPQVWFMNAIGNFDLHQLAAGEKSVREGLRLDVQHQMPRMEYLLSLILAQRQQYHEAAEHMTGYLKLATTPAEIADAQSQLRKLSHLAAITVVPAVEETASTATPK